MTFFGDLAFFIYLIIALIPAIILGIKEKKIKYYTMFLTICFIGFVIGSDVKQLLWLLLYAVIEMLLVKIYALLKRKFGKNKVFYIHAIIFSILP